MSRSIWLVIVLTLVSLVVLLVQAQQSSSPQTAVAPAPQRATLDSAASADVIVASYFHGDIRCVTCIKLESYSNEALQSGFEKELKDSSLIWRLVNWDRDESKHFLDDYQLFTKAVILSRMRGGKEVAWVNLDSIWTLVGDKDHYIKYVQEQTRIFMAAPVK